MRPGQRLKAVGVELKSNSRLRLGAWVILGILLLYGVLELRDDARRQADAYKAVARKLARSQSVASQGEWLGRVERARAMQGDLEKGLWREATVGLAQASFQDWLNQVVQQSNVGRPQATVTVVVEEPQAGRDAAAASGANPAAGLWKVNANLSFDFVPQTLYTLLLAIATKDKRVVIESLAIRGAPAPRAELQLVAYFRKPASAAAKGAT